MKNNNCCEITWHSHKIHKITLQTAANLTLCHCNLGIASDGLKGRVFEVSLADLQNDEVAFRKFKLVTEDVQGKNCLTNFHGMDLTRDKMCSMVKKWQVKSILATQKSFIAKALHFFFIQFHSYARKY